MKLMVKNTRGSIGVILAILVVIALLGAGAYTYFTRGGVDSGLSDGSSVVPTGSGPVAAPAPSSTSSAPVTPAPGQSSSTAGQVYPFDCQDLLTESQVQTSLNNTAMKAVESFNSSTIAYYAYSDNNSDFKCYFDNSAATNQDSYNLYHGGIYLDIPQVDLELHIVASTSPDTNPQTNSTDYLNSIFQSDSANNSTTLIAGVGSKAFGYFPVDVEARGQEHYDIEFISSNRKYLLRVAWSIDDAQAKPVDASKAPAELTQIAKIVDGNLNNY